MIHGHLIFFVIAMEVLTKLMIKEVQVSKQFKFHPNYSKLQITHLCFADDLLMFSSVNVYSNYCQGAGTI